MVIPVNEIFATVQGEGSWTGTPSTFIRLQGCPVGCPWCDTKHTWPVSATKRIPHGEMLAKDYRPRATWAGMNEEHIVAAVLEMRPRHFVITGGEPCLYDLRALTRELATHGTVQIETSGTHAINVSSKCWVTVSPKIDMPGGFEVLESALRRAHEIKMPVASDEDIEALDDLLAQHNVQADTRVWLQPVSQGDEATTLCIDTCLSRNWNLSVQTHKFAGVR